MSPPPSFRHEHLGRRPYLDVLEQQRSAREEILAGTGSDVLFTVEHDPAITGGRRADPADLTASPDFLEERQVAVCSVERGGSWTWHGPGQLVAYPVLALRGWGLRVPDFVAGLEEAMAELSRWSLQAAGVDPEAEGIRFGRRCGYPGTWVFRTDGSVAKIGAVGVHVRRFVSLHGLALNIDPDPWGFDWIQPCGLSDEVTSLARLCRGLGGDSSRLPSLEATAGRLAGVLPERWRLAVGGSAPSF